MRLENDVFYKLLVRPTVVITTVSANGVPNAAPFSWCSPLATKPVPLFGFSTNVNHDTWRNILVNGEFVVNLVGADFGPLMEILERDLPYETSEIAAAGLTAIDAAVVRPPRIGEAFGWLECKMVQSLSLSERNACVIGEVLETEAKDWAMADVVDVVKVKPLNHIWGPIFVTEMQPDRYNRL
jgi:flavin reductase (DIM6/NTAB) family NADH-FMN oxidoreductase RutF